MKAVVAALLLLAAPALADGVDGWGILSAGAGLRWVPNWWFQAHAAAAGTPVTPTFDGGPQGTVSFGYGVGPTLALFVDGFIGYQGFSLTLPDGQENPYAVTSSGAVVGPRLIGTDVLFRGWSPWVSVQAGPFISSITSHFKNEPERLLLSFSASGGCTWRVGERYGVTLEARYVYARSAVTGISGINVGGVTGSVLFTMYFPPSMKRDLDVPGF